MTTLVHSVPSTKGTSCLRHEDLVLQVYCCVLATLGGQLRQYQWLAQAATEQQRKATENLAKSYRSLLPIIMHAAIGALGLASITALSIKMLAELVKPMEIAQGVLTQGQKIHENFGHADRTEEQAASERAQMFYQKFSRDEASADSEHSRLLQAINELFRAEQETKRSIGR